MAALSCAPILAAVEAEDATGAVDVQLRQLQAAGLLAILRQAEPAEGQRILEQLLQAEATYEQALQAVADQRQERQRSVQEMQTRIKELLTQKANTSVAVAELLIALNRRREQLRQLVDSFGLELDRVLGPVDGADAEGRP